MPARVVFELRRMAAVDGAVSCMVSFHCRSRRQPFTTNRLAFYQNLGTWLTVDTADAPPLHQAAHAAAVGWLGPNRRLVVLFSLVAGGLFCLAVAAAAAATQTAGGWRLVLSVLAAGIGLFTVAVVVVAWQAALPRLAARGDMLLVPVGSLRIEQLPLDAVECFFLGSQRLDRSGSPTAGDDPAFRVGTLVVRVAERAAKRHADEWTARGIFAAWEDGYLVIDGRWTEPLTVETLRRVNGRLAQAKRAPVVAGCRSANSAGGCGA